MVFCSRGSIVGESTSFSFMIFDNSASKDAKSGTFSSIGDSRLSGSLCVKPLDSKPDGQVPTEAQGFIAGRDTDGMDI